MEHDLGPAPRNGSGARFESPFDVPHAPAPREEAAERLEHLSCDPFEHAPEPRPERPEDARG